MTARVAEVLVCLCLMPFFSRLAVADDLKEFVQDVNSAWTNRDYIVIISNINARLSVDSNDVLALSLRMNYYLWAELDTATAHGAALSLSNVVHSSQREELYPIADEMVSTVMSVNETNSYTAVQRDKLHSMFPERFPSMVECVFLYSKLAETNAASGN